MTGKPEYDPNSLIMNIAGFLSAQGIDVDLDQAEMTNAYLSASTLLLSLGVNPVVDPTDESAAADTVRDALLIAATKTTTRSRRAL